MTETNGTSKVATLEDHDTLADSKLDAVSGGMLGLTGGSVWTEICGASPEVFNACMSIIFSRPKYGKEP